MIILVRFPEGIVILGNENNSQDEIKQQSNDQHEACDRSHNNRFERQFPLKLGLGHKNQLAQQVDPGKHPLCSEVSWIEKDAMGKATCLSFGRHTV